MKLLKFLTSRFFGLALILTLQIILLVCFAVFISVSGDIYAYYYLLGALILNFPGLIFILNSKANTSYKLSWMLIVGIVPGVGLLFYILYANKRDTKRQKAKLKPYTEDIRKYSTFGPEKLLEIKNSDPIGYLHSNYIYNKNFTRPYSYTYTKYFKVGQDAWPVILDELKKAKHFIFIEMYIIKRGKFWDSILEILKEKAQEGVEVRLLYDDFGCMSKVPYNYYKQLRKFGINAVLFQRYKAFLNVKMNNRDHRKMIIIDGHTSFTGGINLADEYVNINSKYGEWKDNFMMLKGEGTYGLTILFLSMWNNYLKTKTDIFDYSFAKYQSEFEFPEEPKGFIQPYGDIPFDYESVGANVYLNLISRATKYIYISTPYLVLDDTFLSTLRTVARSGVEIRILLPGIPDKKVVYELSQSFAYELGLCGVQIYYYKPGFNHMKTILVDDKYASVGTINLDLRSFHLNYENAILINDGNCINDIKNDFEEMFSKSKKAHHSSKTKVSFFKKVWWAILKCISPMF